jgi:hypothetical protein
MHRPAPQRPKLFMEERNDIEAALLDTRPLPLSIVDFKKRLDPSASYLIAEQSSSRYGQPDLSAFAELAATCGKATRSRHLIYDASIGKLILVIKLRTTTVDDQFLIDAIASDTLKTMKVYLYSSR